MKDQPDVKDIPATAEVPSEPQPVPPYVQPVAGQQIQYVNIVNQKSLEGLGGWLMFWLVVFVLNGLSYITFFFALIAAPEQLKEAFGIVSILMMPVLVAGYISSAVFIALRKKLAVMTSSATFGVLALYMVIMLIISATKSDAPIGETLPMTVGLILTILVTNGLFALYFFVSKRVKATLIK